jgi:glycosyltransferase involved in cell wall biosynthesis
MAAGRAIITTSLGWEGLPHIQPDRDLVVADTPEEFARAAIELLGDPARRGRMADEARRVAERQYDWRRLGDAQETVLSEVVRRR